MPRLICAFAFVASLYAFAAAPAQEWTRFRRIESGGARHRLLGHTAPVAQDVAEDGISVGERPGAERPGDIVQHGAVMIAGECVIESLGTITLIGVPGERTEEDGHGSGDPLASGALVGAETGADLLERVIVEMGA